ncbi:MAG: hypothetical protein VYC34_08105, partial [Planctomycetota bacterium]|nr:hypothetical protein [Planctomycetota bacterium]
QARVWNGTNFDDASPYTMTLNFGPSPDVTSPLTPGGFVAGFDIPVGSMGFDDHLNIFLDVGSDTPTGVFLLTLQVRATGLAASDPIYFVMNAGAGEEAHEAAEEYVREFIVPSPSGAALMGLAGAALLRRRR